MKLEFFRFLEDAKIQDFMKICPVRTELFHANAWTYVTKLMVAFRSFATTPKNYNSHCSWRRACCSIMVVGCEACGWNMKICRGSYWWPTWKSEEFTHFWARKLSAVFLAKGWCSYVDSTLRSMAQAPMAQQTANFPQKLVCTISYSSHFWRQRFSWFPPWRSSCGGGGLLAMKTSGVLLLHRRRRDASSVCPGLTDLPHTVSSFLAVKRVCSLRIVIAWY
jgi:hypothetical protein